MVQSTAVSFIELPLFHVAVEKAVEFQSSGEPKLRLLTPL